MNDADLTNLVDKLKSAIEDQVKETVYLQTLQKDREVSGLHREINNKLRVLTSGMEEVKVVIGKHDVVISEIMDIYKTSGRIKKVIVWVILFVPSVAAFLVASDYIYHLFIQKQ